jgi:hypothetical protein
MFDFKEKKRNTRREAESQNHWSIKPVRVGLISTNEDMDSIHPAACQTAHHLNTYSVWTTINQKPPDMGVMEWLTAT